MPRGVRGSVHYCSKLDEPSVIEVLYRLDCGAQPTALAKEFGVSYSTIRDIRDRRTWRHLGRWDDGEAVDG
jgi:hypothetical protein